MSLTVYLKGGCVLHVYLQGVMSLTVYLKEGMSPTKGQWYISQ